MHNTYTIFAVIYLTFGGRNWVTASTNTWPFILTKYGAANIVYQSRIYSTDVSTHIKGGMGVKRESTSVTIIKNAAKITTPDKAAIPKRILL